MNYTDDALGPLKNLQGTWKGLAGKGWNMIALPFSGGASNYRLLLNQYDEEIDYTLVDDSVPNRGVKKDDKGHFSQTDQFIATLDYQQNISQIEAMDFPRTSASKEGPKAIHHEPGLLLHMINYKTEDLNIARLASVPHGSSVLAMGQSSIYDGGPRIANISGLPIGGGTDLKGKYLEPYNHFHEKLFQGVFDPTIPNQLLIEENKGINIIRTTELRFDTTISKGGINNLPFITNQANATEMKAVFWIQELAEKDRYGHPKLRLQYSQQVNLEFFPRTDGDNEALIIWPHISINTLEKIS